jgi:hypothetical protein
MVYLTLLQPEIRMACEKGCVTVYGLGLVYVMASETVCVTVYDSGSVYGSEYGLALS